MFRKPRKGIIKEGNFRRRKQQDEDGNVDNKRGSNNDDNDTDDDPETSLDLTQSRKRIKKANTRAAATSGSSSTTSKTIMHHFDANGKRLDSKELATRINELHRTSLTSSKSTRDNDEEISKQPTKKKNTLLAGPIKVSNNIRTTCRFDYQPDICKDYKETGFCGFGDTCIYLHDRGDTLSGWQLERQWEQEQKRKQQAQQDQVDAFLKQNYDKKFNNSSNDKDNVLLLEDGLPFACHICRNPFQDPIVTTCGHYFCQGCIMNHVKSTSQDCPICNKDTHGVFHQPIKLISKKRKLCNGRRDSTWKEYHDACLSNKNNNNTADD